MEGSSSEDSSEYKDWEIPTHSIAKLKEYGYITLDEAGELILKPGCAEKAKEILRQEECVNDKHTPCYSTNPASTDDGTNIETRMVAQTTNRNYDEMMVAQFMISLPAENVAAKPHLQQLVTGRGRLDSLRDNVSLTQSSPGRPKKGSGKGATKPKKPTKKELQALQVDMERKGELDIATSIPPSSSPGPRPAGPRGQKLPPTLNVEYGRKEDFDSLSSFSPSSSPRSGITGSRGQKLPPVLKAVNMDHGRKEELYNAISFSTLSLPGPGIAGPRGQKLPLVHNNVTAPSGTNAQLRMNFSSPKSVLANFQNETLYYKPGLARRVSSSVSIGTIGIMNNPESFSQPVSEFIPVTRSISEEVNVQHKIMNDSSIQNVHTANITSKNILEPNTSLHHDLRISPIVSTSNYRPATLQYTSGKIQHGSIGSLNQGGVVTSIVLSGATASISQNLANSLQSPQIIVANPALRNQWQQSNGKTYTTSQPVEVARATASVEHKLAEYHPHYFVMTTGTACQTGGGKGKKKKTHLDDYNSSQSPKDASNSDNESAKSSPVVFGTPQLTVSAAQPVLGESPPRVKAPHCPKFLPGKLALCLNCGGGSKDITRCHPCGKDLPTDVRLVDDVRPKEIISLESRPILVQSRNASVPVIIKKIVTTSSGEMPSIPTTSIIGPVRKDLPRSSVKKRKVHEEPECLTLSSDDEGENNQPAPKLAVEDNFEIPEFDVSKLNEGETLVEFWAGCMQVVKIGLVNSKVSEKLQNIFIVESGFHITVESPDGEATNIWIPKEHITRIEYNMEGKFKLLAIYVAPPMANWIRNRLKISDKMFDVNSSAGALKRILVIVDHIKTNTEDCIQLLVKYYSDVLVDGVDTQAILASYAKLDKNNDEAIEKNNDAQPPSEEELRFVPLDLSKTLFTYPPAPEKGGISITGEDFMCLEDEQFLNDSMIDFYLKYLQVTKLSADEREKIHIFSTYFYKRLTHKPTSKRRPAFEDDPNLTPEEKRHCRVKSWTKNVDIFEKDYLLVPICEKSHWFLAIICFPYLQGPVLAKDNTPIELPSTPKRRRKTQVSEVSSMKSFKIGSTTIIPIKLPMSEEVKAAALSLNDDSDRDEAESDSELEEAAVNSDENLSEKRDLESKIEPNVQSSQNSTASTEEAEKEEPEEPKTAEVTSSTIDATVVDGEPVKQPCILVFDSLEGPSRGKIVATLREYLKVEFKVKKKEDRPFKDFVKGVMLKVPQQTNYSDCGLYVLQYAENFFEFNPLKDFRTPIPSMRNWFDPMVVIRKREDLGNLIHNLTEEQNPGLSDSLPDIKFPTIDGELVHLDEEYYEEEEEEEMSDEYDHEEEYYSDDSAQTQPFDVITPAWRNESTEEGFDPSEDGADQEIWEPEEDDPHKVEVAEIGGEVEVDSEEDFKENNEHNSEEGTTKDEQLDRLVATDPNFKITRVEPSSDVSEEEGSMPILIPMNSVDTETKVVSGAVLKLENPVEIEKRKTNENCNVNGSKRRKLVEYGDSGDSGDSK